MKDIISQKTTNCLRKFFLLISNPTDSNSALWN